MSATRKTRAVLFARLCDRDLNMKRAINDF
jgi:hypothetical protein